MEQFLTTHIMKGFVQIFQVTGNVWQNILGSLLLQIISYEIVLILCELIFMSITIKG